MAHPHSTEDPEGSPILTPGCKLRKLISRAWGLAGKHPAGQAMQSPALLKTGRTPAAEGGVVSAAEMPPDCVGQGQGGAGSWSVTATVETPPGRGDRDGTMGPWNCQLADSGPPGAADKEHVELVPAGLTRRRWPRGLRGKDPRVCAHGALQGGLS